MHFAVPAERQWIQEKTVLANCQTVQNNWPNGRRSQISTKGKRPEFKQMIDFIRTQKEKIVVLAYNTDRLQRDFDEQSLELKSLVNQNKADQRSAAASIWKNITSCQIHFISTRQKITKEADSSTKFRYGLDVLLANDYANRISDNAKRSVTILAELSWSLVI